MEIRLGTKSQIVKRIFPALLACLMVWSPVSASHDRLSQLGRYATSKKGGLLIGSTVLASFFALHNIIKGYRFLYNEENKKNKAEDKTQEMAKTFFDAMIKSDLPGPLGSFLTYFRKKTCSSPPVVYKNSLTKIIPSNSIGIFSPIFGIHLQDNIINAIEEKQSTEKSESNPLSKEGALALLHHEVVHAWQHSSFIRSLNNYTSFWRKTKFWYHIEYQANQKTIEQLYKMKMYKGIEAQLEKSIKQVHPYSYGTLDAYIKLLTTHPKDKELPAIRKKIISKWKKDLAECLLKIRKVVGREIKYVQEKIELLRDKIKNRQDNNEALQSKIKDLQARKKVALERTMKYFKKDNRQIIMNTQIIQLNQPKQSKGWRTRYREYLKNLTWKQWLLARWSQTHQL